MRDFRDAKTMAQTLRQSLTAKSVTVSHSESLELVSKMLGAADWNTLSALIRSGRSESPPAEVARPELPGRYPAIPLRDLVPFPTATYPIFVGRAEDRAGARPFIRAPAGGGDRGSERRRPRRPGDGRLL